MKKRPNWASVKEMMGNRKVELGQHISYQLANTPRRLLFTLSYYKFAAKMIGDNKSVLDVGCGEGLGSWLLSVECGKTKGIDIDDDAIKIGKRNWKGDRISFECVNFFDMANKKYDAIVAFDVIEHILPDNVERFLSKIADCLNHDGIAILGTPSITSQAYASAVTRAGHVNLYSGEKLEKELIKHFSHIFMFAANDEVVHTGFLPMAHYLIAVGCCKRI